MIFSLAILMAGSIAEISSKKWQDWLGAACLVRLGVGLAQSILITYISELAPFQIRGACLGAYQVLLTTGQLIVAIAAQLIQVHQPTKWRPLIGIEFFFTGVCMVKVQEIMTDPISGFTHRHLVYPRITHLPRPKGST